MLAAMAARAPESTPVASANAQAFRGFRFSLIKDLAMDFWLPRLVPFIQLDWSVARILFWDNAFTGCAESVMGRTAARIPRKPMWLTPPPKTLVASTKPDAAVPNPPIAVTISA